MNRTHCDSKNILPLELNQMKSKVCIQLTGEQPWSELRTEETFPVPSFMKHAASVAQAG